MCNPLGEIPDLGRAIGDGNAAECCAFVIDGAPLGSATRVCQAPRRPGSSYCERHHALCRLPGGSTAERRKLHEIEMLALVAGGRQPRPGQQPKAAQLRRLDRLARVLSGASRSRNVP
jgi:hypothetical protein